MKIRLIHKPRFIAASLLFSLLCLPPLHGQESTDTTGADAAGTEVSGSAEAAAPEGGESPPAAEGEASSQEPPKPEAADGGETDGEAAGDETQDFLNRSYKYDINTSRREELIAWCQVLKLPSDGTVEQLKTRLFDYYSLQETEPDSTEKTGDQVIIESAKRTEYLEIDIGGDKKESIVRLSGDVLLTVQESSRNRKHQVHADTILFNDDNNTISAVGNIEYIVNTNGREERFTGDSLTFEVSGWTGIIFHGTSERKEKINEKEVPFFFRGKSIKRASAHILVLDDGSITSYDVENPDYALNAKKIWITGPGEWSLFSATIYVGHVPVLYLPFYWKSGRDLFFNPVIGQRNDVGYYIQTTMYLLGRKGEDDDFTMLGFGDSAGAEY
ncbi:MAG: hypothetical protein B0D92_06390, partial [Spirochaeta sp. LUC14_002_19_P3]